MPLDGQSDAATALDVQPPAQKAAAALGAGYGPGMVANTVQQLRQAQAEREKAQKPIYDQMQADYTADKQRVAEAAKDYTPISPISPAPKPPPNDPLQGFGSVASIFASVASAFTHTPAINAMNGMAAAINGAKQGNWEEYEAGYKQWKDSTELAIQHHRLQAEDMKNAMEMMKTNLTAGVAMAKAVAAQTDDKIAETLLEQGQYEKLAQVQMERQRLSVSMADHALRVEEMHNRMTLERPLLDATKNLVEAQKSGDPVKIEAAQRAYADTKAMMSGVARPGSQESQRIAVEADIRREHPDWTLGQIALEARKRMKDADNSGGEISDEGAKLVAERVLAGDAAATTGLARSAKNIAKVDSMLADIAKQRGLSGADIAFKVAQFHGLMGAERTLGTRAANLGLAMNEAKAFAPMVLETSAKLDRSQFPTLNSMEMALDRGTGGEDVVRFIGALNAFKNVYAQIVTRGGVNTDDSRRRADEVLEKSWSQGQIAAGVEQLMKEITAAQAAPAATQSDLQSAFTGGSPAQSGPAPGTIENGYRFKGGNPADQSSWERVQ